MRFIYLHGFASSPASRKARFFADKLARHGISVEIPELAPNFEKLTISSQLEIVACAAKGSPSVLIGSSLGGYLAALYSALHPDVDRLVMLAPAFDFVELWKKEIGTQKFQEWRESGSIRVYHYGTNREMPLRFELMKDAGGYPAFPDFQQPSLILHGLKDAVVPFDQSARYAAKYPDRTTLVPFNSGHELTDVLDEVWNSASSFLLGGNTKDC